MSAQDWEAVAVLLVGALTELRDTRAWRLGLPPAKVRALDREAVEAIQAFERLRGPGQPTDAERLATRLLEEWEGSCCEELEDGLFVCLVCDAHGSAKAQVPHDLGCVGWLAERLAGRRK